MHVISRSTLADFWAEHPDAEAPLRTWYRIARLASWRHFADLQRSFPSADLVGNLIVFNVGGNRFRLIAYVDYACRKVFVRSVLRNTAKNRGKTTRGFDEEYRTLCRAFPPRAITSGRQMMETQGVINSIIDKRTRLSKAEREYLNTLGTLVFDYEERHVEVPTIHGVDLLRHLMEDRGLRQKDLVPVFRTESIASAVLNGHRQLTRRHIEELAQFFSVPAAAFLPDAAPAARVA